MASTIKHKRSSVPGKIPTTGQLEAGELAINFADKALYTKDSTGNVIALNDWENIQNKPVIQPQATDELYTGNSSPLVTEYSYWWNQDTQNFSVSDGNTWQQCDTGPVGEIINVTANQTREYLTADRTYYVATTGLNSNDGLTAGTPFATIQYAVDFVANNIDLGGKTVTIQIADGTYNESVRLKHLVGYSSALSGIIIQGNQSNISAVTVQGNGTDTWVFTAPNGEHGYLLRYMRVQSTKASVSNIASARNAVIQLSQINFGSSPSNNSNLVVYFGGQILITGGHTISGSVTRHLNASSAGSIIFDGTQTITITGTPAFSQEFARAVGAGVIVIRNSITFSGSATGRRYNVSLNGLIDTNGAATTYFPGNTAGTTATGGIYS